MKRDAAMLLTAALDSLGVSDRPAVEIEIPREESFGDLSTPVAMGLAKELRSAPRKIAESIAARLRESPVFESVAVAGPGFINLSFTRTYLHDSLAALLRSERAFLREDIGKGRRVLVEFVSANPTGPLHIGHARGAAVGDALCNILAESGFLVEREYYVNDAGRQVKLLGLSVYAKYQQLLGEDAPFPEDGYRGQYIDDEAAALRTEMQDRYRGVSFADCGEEIAAWTYRRMLGLIRADLDRFGIRAFDTWTSERELFAAGQVTGAIEDLKRRGHIYDQDGAVWFRSSDFGDDKDRVVVKSDGDYTYFSSDIAYHKSKLDRGYDIIIDIWGADHHGYIPRIGAVMQAFGYDVDKFRVILVQMVNLLKHGEPFQMSKRAGNFVLLSEIIELVGADMTKFIFLTRKSDSHLDFDVDVVTASSAENPVFYVQYANARINSILANAAAQSEPFSAEADLSLLGQPEELRIIKKLLVYPMALESAARALEPHRITIYLQELAAMFHTYYHNHRILGNEPALTAARLALCRAVQLVIGDALRMLGVSAPEKM